MANCKHCNKFVCRKNAVFCGVQCKAEWQRTQKPVDKDWLVQKYLVEGLGIYEIGALVNRNPKQVWQWLKGYDIPTRKRGQNPKVHFQKDVATRTGISHSEETREKLRQARLRDGHVPYLKNGVHHLKGKRGAETPNWKGGVTPERNAVYNSKEWKTAVKAVWKRDNATCQRCKMHHSEAKKESVDFDIHHIASFAVKELRCEASNLVLLCEPCHYFVHSKKNIQKEFIDG